MHDDDDNNNDDDNDDDDDDNDDDDDDNDNDSPRWLLPNCTHNDLDVPSRKKEKTPILVERWQHHKQLNIW